MAGGQDLDASKTTVLRSMNAAFRLPRSKSARLIISAYEYNARILIFFQSETVRAVFSVADSIRKAQQYLRVETDNLLRSVNLTAPQYFALAALAAQSGLSGAAVARRCFVTPQTPPGIIANLAANGLITREADPEHGRVIRTLLTSEGAAVLATARVQVEQVEAGMLQDIDPVEREALADLLAQCADALAQMK